MERQKPGFIDTRRGRRRSAPLSRRNRQFRYHTTAIALLLAVMPVGLPLAKQQQPYQLDYLHPDACFRSDGLTICAKKIETLAIRATTPAVTRKGNALCLVVASQPTPCYRDRDSLHYAFAGMFLDAYMVLELIDEGWELLLVSRQNGTEIRLPSYPVPNPSGTLFATASYDVDAGYRANIVQIWSIPAKPAPAMTVTEFPPGLGPASIEWQSDTQLQALLVDIDGLQRGLLLANLTASGWRTKLISPTED